MNARGVNIGHPPAKEPEPIPNLLLYKITCFAPTLSGPKLDGLGAAFS